MTAFSNKQSHQTLGSVLRIIARCRWFEENLGSEVVFGFVAHVHDRTPLPILLRSCRKVTSYSNCSVQFVFLHVFLATLVSFTTCEEA